MYVQYNKFVSISLLMSLLVYKMGFCSETCNTNPLIHGDLAPHIFHAGTERSNTALRCTCKTLYHIGKQYRDNQSATCSEKFKSITWAILEKPQDVSIMDGLYENPPKIRYKCFPDDQKLIAYLPTLMILPGGKAYCVHGTYQEDGGSQCYRGENIDTFIKGAQQAIHAPDNFPYTGTDIMRRYQIGLSRRYKWFSGEPNRYIDIFNGKKHMNVHELDIFPSLTPESFIKKTTAAFEINMPHYYPPRDKMLQPNYINTDRVTISFIDNQYHVVTHEKQCTLDGKKLPYNVLDGLQAKTEYEFDYMSQNSNNINGDMPPLIGTKHTCVSFYKLKKDSLLHDERAQKYLYKVLQHYPSTAHLNSYFSNTDLVGYYVTLMLFMHKPSYNNYSFIIARAICNKESLFSQLLNYQTPRAIHERMNEHKFQQVFTRKKNSFDEYCTAVEKLVDEEYNALQI